MIVLALGYWVYRDAQATEVAALLLEDKAQAQPSPTREVASLSGAALPKIIAHSHPSTQAITVQMPCYHQPEVRHQSATTQLRIKGEFCQLTPPDKTLIHVTNNNFQGTVFTIAGRNYSSDILRLNQGENTVHIKHQWNEGGQTREVVQALHVTVNKPVSN